MMKKMSPYFLKISDMVSVDSLARDEDDDNDEVDDEIVCPSF